MVENLKLNRAERVRDAAVGKSGISARFVIAYYKNVLASGDEQKRGKAIGFLINVVENHPKRARIILDSIGTYHPEFTQELLKVQPELAKSHLERALEDRSFSHARWKDGWVQTFYEVAKRYPELVEKIRRNGLEREDTGGLLRNAMGSSDWEFIWYTLRDDISIGITTDRSRALAWVNEFIERDAEKMETKERVGILRACNAFLAGGTAGEANAEDVGNARSILRVLKAKFPEEYERDFIPYEAPGPKPLSTA